MQNSEFVGQRAKLQKRPRISEMLIQGFLFLCGALSILITMGIVYELGKESMLFFTRQQWEQTNKFWSSILRRVGLFEVAKTGSAL